MACDAAQSTHSFLELSHLTRNLAVPRSVAIPLLLSMYASSQLGRGGVNTKQQLSRLQEQQPAAIMLGTAAWRLVHTHQQQHQQQHERMLGVPVVGGR